MRIITLIWNEENTEHIMRKHSTSPPVHPREVEEACFLDEYLRIERGKGTKRYQKKGQIYYLLGQTEAGRYLFIVGRYLGRGKMRPITARDMNKADKARYKRRRR